MAVVSRISKLRIELVADPNTFRQWLVTAAVQDTPAGSSVSVTIAMTTGGVAPGVPDTLTLRYADDGGTTIRTVALTPDSASQSDTFFFTNDGTSGGSARCGTVEMKLQATRGGVGAYDVETDGSPNTPGAGNQSQLDRGWIRSTTTLVEDISNTSLGGAPTAPGEYDESLFVRTTCGAASYVPRALTVALSAGSVSGSTNSTTSPTRDVTFSNVVDDRFPAASTTVGVTVTVPNAALTGSADWSFSSQISSWADSSGLGNNALQADSGKQPLAVSDVLNGKSVARFDGSNDLLRTAAFSSQAQPNVVFIVCKVNSAAPAANNVFCDGIASTDRHAIYAQSAGTTFSMFAGLNVTGDALNTNFNILTAVFDGASSVYYRNGTQIGAADAGAHTLTGVTLGADFSDGQSLAGDIAEYLLLDSNPSSATRQGIEKWLGDKFAIIVAGGVSTDPTGVAGKVVWLKSESLPGAVTDDTIAVDPRVIAGHHFQVDDDVFGLSKNEASKQMLSTQSGFLWTRITGARGTGINSITLTQTLDPSNPGTTVSGSSSTSTQDSQAGWSGRLDWTAVKPGGSWAKSVDITAPSDIDADTHLLSGTDTLTMLNVDPRVGVIVSMAPTTDGEADHLKAGDNVTIVTTLYSRSTWKRLAPDSGTIFVGLIRWSVADSRFEYLASNGTTWTNWSGTTTTAATVAMTAAGDGVTFTKAFTSTSGWGSSDIVAVAIAAQIDGTPYGFYTPRELVGTSNQHSGYSLDSLDLALNGLLSQR